MMPVYKEKKFDIKIRHELFGHRRIFIKRELYPSFEIMYLVHGARVKTDLETFAEKIGNLMLENLKEEAGDR